MLPGPTGTLPSSRRSSPALAMMYWVSSELSVCQSSRPPSGIVKETVHDASAPA